MHQHSAEPKRSSRVCSIGISKWGLQVLDTQVEQHSSCC
jgi:hypothetical protein